MNGFWKAFLQVGKTIGEQMVPGIAAVEEAVKAIKSGPDKKAAVLELVKASLDTAESVTNKDFVNDPEFNQGLEMVNDGYVKILHSMSKNRTPDNTPVQQ